MRYANITTGEEEPRTLAKLVEGTYPGESAEHYALLLRFELRKALAVIAEYENIVGMEEPDFTRTPEDAKYWAYGKDRQEWWFWSDEDKNRRSDILIEYTVEKVPHYETESVA